MLACSVARLGLFPIAAVTTHVNAFASSVDERVLVEYKMTGSPFIFFYSRVFLLGKICLKLLFHLAMSVVGLRLLQAFV